MDRGTCAGRNNRCIHDVTRRNAAIAVSPQIAVFDTWAMLISAILLVVFAVTGWRISRAEGAVLIGVYAIYVAAQIALGLGAGGENP